MQYAQPLASTTRASCCTAGPESGAADVGPRPPRLSRPVRLRRSRVSGSVVSWRAASASC
ncbi:hypothetical protein HMPREF1549_00967 [Actinomyces johnsonii F0510]|uniref:Uncharacterized protein n=1 Tax=Actinomyces johnsonii F0510 TaxID=1227262 RepID=U1QG79_9ACTO|nr:hypothetical protein HMPREF1549_00967 [Actinomyces johnsonii F0510]